MVDELIGSFSKEESPWMNHKDLERKLGFLGHLAMCYASLVPFMKGFHLRIDSWRPKRPTSGWKMGDKAGNAYLEGQVAEGRMSEEELEAVLAMLGVTVAPELVRAVPRFKLDLNAMSLFFKPALPPEVTDRVSKILYVMYGFGDASGMGFRSSIQTVTGLLYRIGVWVGDEGNKTSNYWEFTNVVDALEEEGAIGRLADCCVFLCTDNSTVEAAIFKRSSKIEKLYALVVRFLCLQSKFGVLVTVSHVSWKRMIAQGADRLSRGF
jgi:hypothetical protein